MTENLARQRPESFFSDRFNVTPGLMERLLGSNLAGRVDDADVYLEYRVNEELVLEENVVKKASRHVSQGAAVRAQSGTRTGYAHTDDISVGNLEEAARQARAIADRAGQSGTIAVAGRGRPHDLYTLAEPPILTELARKLELMRTIDAGCRAADPRVTQVIVTLTSEEVVMLIATASGWSVGDVRPLTRLNVTAIAEEGGRREIGTFGGGGRVPFDFYLDPERWKRFAVEAARQATLKRAAGGGGGGRRGGRGPGGGGGGGGPRGHRRRRGRATPAAAAHDQHVHARRPGRSGRHLEVGQTRPLRRELRRWAGGHHERQVRLLGQRGLPDRGRAGDEAREGRHPDRQRARRAHAREPRGSRPGAGRGRRHLRQVRPVAARGRRPADHPHRRHDRGRHRRLNTVDPTVLTDVLARATARGATAADGFLIEEQAFSASVRLGQVATVTHSPEQRLALRVFAGRASAAASTSDLSRESLERVVDEATALARVTAEDPHAGLPDPAELIERVPELELEDHEGPEPTPEQKIELARRAEAAALAADARITNSEGAEYFDRRARYAYATSHGFARGYSTSSVGLTVSPVASENGEMQRDYWYTAARHRAQLEAPDAIGRTAAPRALRRLGARKVKTTEVPVIFDPDTAASLLRSVAGAASGPSLYRRASFLLQRLGTRVAGPAGAIVDDGLLPRALGSRPFDGAGLAP